MLVLDEAQVLASAVNTDLTHALRAGLDTRKQTIKVIFAGSSENLLRQMFARATEPFYNWSPIEPFERLGAEFVAAMTRKVNTLCRFRLSERDALRAFDALKRTPEFFRRFLGRYLQYADQGTEAALQDTVAHVFSDSGFRTIWARLNPTDRAVLRAMAQGERDLHSVAVRSRLGEELGLGKRVPAGTPRNALTRLQKAELVTRVAHGDYQIQDEGLLEVDPATGTRRVDPLGLLDAAARRGHSQRPSSAAQALTPQRTTGAQAIPRSRVRHSCSSMKSMGQSVFFRRLIALAGPFRDFVDLGVRSIFRLPSQPAASQDNRRMRKCDRAVYQRSR